MNIKTENVQSNPWYFVQSLILKAITLIVLGFVFQTYWSLFFVEKFNLVALSYGTCFLMGLFLTSIANLLKLDTKNMDEVKRELDEDFFRSKSIEISRLVIVTFLLAVGLLVQVL